MRVMLLGAGGLAGTALSRRCPPHVHLIALNRAALDVTDPKALREAVARHHPEAIVNAAAYTDVDRAELEPESAFAVNAAAPGQIGEIGAGSGVRVLHLSTDFVFDGRSGFPLREEHDPAPINVYGASKLAGERALMATGARVLIVRTQSLFGPGGSSFVGTMVRRARAGQFSRVVADTISCPTYTLDLADALWALVGSGALGLLHAANAGTASWYDVARHIYQAIGRPELCTPCAAAEYATFAQRPAFSCLDAGRLARRLGYPLPHWRNALDRFLEEALRDT